MMQLFFFFRQQSKQAQESHEDVYHTQNGVMKSNQTTMYGKEEKEKTQTRWSRQTPNFFFKDSQSEKQTKTQQSNPHTPTCNGNVSAVVHILRRQKRREARRVKCRQIVQLAPANDNLTKYS